jgi:hypothetical protein
MEASTTGAGSSTETISYREVLQIFGFHYVALIIYIHRITFDNSFSHAFRVGSASAGFGKPALLF